MRCMKEKPKNVTLELTLETIGKGEKMTAREYLQSLEYMDTVINQKIRELEDLRLTMKNPSAVDYTRDKVQTSHSQDAAFVPYVHKMIELEQEINADIDEYVDRKHEIIQNIQKLCNPVFVQLLFKKYVQFKHFKEIADEMGYTYQYIRELHGQALDEFGRSLQFPT